MSQQEFAPEPQKQRDRLDQGAEYQRDDEIYARPYTQSTSSSMPKEDHPSTYEASIPPYSYRAQENTTYNQRADRVVDEKPPTQRARREQQQQERFSSRENASGTQTNAYSRYRYNANWQVPPWARPQPQRPGRMVWRILAIVILCVILVKLLPIFIALALAIIGVIGIMLLTVLLPILIVLALLFLFISRIGFYRRWRGF